MRGAGRVFQPKVRGRKTAFWWCDYTSHGCACGTCDASGRHREPTGVSDYTEALGILAQRREARRIGRPVTAHERPVSTALWPYAQDHIVRKAGRISERWLDNTWRHLERAAEFFGPEMPLAAVKPSDVRKWDAARERSRSYPGGDRAGSNVRLGMQASSTKGGSDGDARRDFGARPCDGSWGDERRGGVQRSTEMPLERATAPVS